MCVYIYIYIYINRYLQKYTKHFDTYLISVEMASPTYDSSSVFLLRL